VKASKAAWFLIRVRALERDTHLASCKDPPGEIVLAARLEHAIPFIDFPELWIHVSLCGIGVSEQESYQYLTETSLLKPVRGVTDGMERRGGGVDEADELCGSLWPCLRNHGHLGQ
jgi:hypothetical protein